MSTLREIKDHIEEGKSLKLITQAFTDIASTKLKRIRNRVERNRVFFEDLTKIYNLVNQLAVLHNIKAGKKNGKTLSILITSNFRFYGKITNDLIAFFLKQTAGLSVDRIIVGKTAVTYLNAINYKLPYSRFLLKADYPDFAEMKVLTETIKDYTQVLVYYSEFKSVLLQIPNVKDITRSARQMNLSDKEQLKKLHITFNYILEPEIREILDFFDAQIKGRLLEQTFLESELARTGSRLITMDNAQNEAEEYLKEQKRNLFSAQRTILNSRILEAYAALQESRKLVR